MRWRRLTVAIAAIVVVGVGVVATVMRKGPRAAELQPLTPPSPVVDRLRGEVRGANVVICVIDAARADHVGYYGYLRDTTPNIDRLARESVVFREHFAEYPSTKPSTASLLTGQHSDTHLAYGNRELPEGTFTLAKGLERAGLRTVMFSSNPNASPATGLGRDFREVFDQSEVEPLVEGWEQFTNPKPLLTLIRRWLDRNNNRRFFAYVHFDPPHQPYLQPEEMTKLFAGQKPPNFRPGRFEFPVGDREMLRTCARPPLPEWINLYDANLRFGDWAVGELERALREAGVLQRTLLVITSDHGEAFGEHGYLWHERGVYDELVHIPLLIRFPGGVEAGEVKALTETVDVLPTVLDLLAAPYPEKEVQGKSLAPLIAGAEKELHHYVVARSDGRPPSYLVRSREWALMLWGNGKWRALYDLRTDPGQRHNVIERNPEVAERMVGAFREFAAGQRRPPVEFVEAGAKAEPLPEGRERKLSEETKRGLRALGYVR